MQWCSKDQQFQLPFLQKDQIREEIFNKYNIYSHKLHGLKIRLWFIFTCIYICESPAERKNEVPYNSMLG